ncbi:MAG: sigma-54-dependent Fis family transcriptional regulator [Nitrospirae bacterium]|nr:MAG: sigma-54-dependent Fis family transcriptional regulator [Nitrospirota bacterium]
MAAPIRLLILDDEPLFLETLQRIFEREGMRVATAERAERALDLLAEEPFDVVLADIVMPGMDGLTFLARARDRDDPPEVVMITAHATVETALAAMKQGAYDYLQKPAEVEEVEQVVRRAYEHRRLTRENARLRRLLRRNDPYGEIVGKSPAITEVRRLIERVAPTDSTVLILGESGTGKELVAHQVHRASPRGELPMVTVNCGALQASLLANELFGHARGAFTGADQARPGLFEEADGATLFIDEVGEMELEVQKAFLRALESGEVKRLGESRPRRVDVRLIAATNRDLSADVEAGRFRRDLYYRLAVFTIEVPPLRERREDIPLLVERYLEGRAPGVTCSEAALERLLAHDWPGNVRELFNALERGLIMAEGDTLRPQDLPPLGRGTPAAATPPPPRAAAAATAPPPATPGAAADGTFLPLAELERRHLEAAMAQAGGNKTRAAQLLGLSLRSLYTKLKRHGLAR